VTLLGDTHEIVIATLSPPRLRSEDELEIEQETALVGEADGGAEAGGAGAGDETAGAGENAE
jgi:hypothetical protein